ncbi:NlpC/P60 family protein [Parasulfitobacter algicola]|uniref:C40 family peptidase n=1 Tax=Parasulfitobacter algicola TaxID=2614809 RepID=A0ABX2ITJ2_9RHOB|nr:NlpC/P60 family protein [Sulfitobacter algicola]NSX56247.1 C40 family peptidase [Sulfitobacter algicola]
MNSLRGEDVAQVARSWIGTPYRHQCSVKGAGSDCLGLLRGVWRECFDDEPENVPAYTADWSEPQGDEILLKAAQQYLFPVDHRQIDPGDVVLFRLRENSIAKHLGIIGKTGDVPTFIHAYSGHSVVESPLSNPWTRRIAARFSFFEEIN